MALAIAVLALASRRPAAVCLAAALLATSLAQRSMAGLAGPERATPIQAEVTVLSDPRPTRGGGVQADVRLDGRRWALRAYRAPAAALGSRMAGERILVMGELRPPGSYEQGLPHRHLAGRLRVDAVVGWQEGHGVTRLANGLRRTLSDGAQSLSERQRSLLSGLLLGDDRHQPADLTVAFRRAGLAHLLAVSGQNVAFLLTAVSPLLLRLRLAPRLLVTLLVLAGFALLTRGEPSVLRATTMAAIGAFGAATGRPSSGLRRLTVAVTGLLLCDPLLARSLGFQLSAAGAGGIIVGARRVADRLPGPLWLRLPASVTIAAELAVAPVLVATLGSVPLAALPANMLAVPAAGPVTMWGLTGGLAAGLVGEPLASALHAPTRLLLWWLDRVSAVMAGLPVGEIRAPHAAALVMAGAAVAGARRLPSAALSTGLRSAGWAAAVVTLGVATVSVAESHDATHGRVEIGPGMDMWDGHAVTVVVIDGRATEDWLLSELRGRDIDKVDVLIVRTSASRAVTVATRLRERWPSMQVLAPAEVTEYAGTGLEGAVTPAAGDYDVAGLRLRFDVEGDRLDPHITLAEGDRPP
jgi:competence protein ComEC